MEALILETSNSMNQVIEHYEKEISKIRTGRANPNLLDNVKVLVYGNLEPLKSLAGIQVPEARQLLIKVFDINNVKTIVETLKKAGVGLDNLDYQINGNNIRLQFPTLTEDLRKRLVREVTKITEEFRVKIRNHRRDGLQKLKKQNLPEDLEKKFEQEIQKLTDEKIKLINKIDENKVKDLMHL